MNATFYYFKRSGKFYSSDRGLLPPSAFNVAFTPADRRRAILDHNDGAMPGLISKAEDFYVVVIGDETNSFGWPLHLPPMAE